MNDLEIKHTKGNKNDSLPEHWDIWIKGQSDSVITVWDSKEMADECAFFLEHRAAIREFIAQQKKS